MGKIFSFLKRKFGFATIILAFTAMLNIFTGCPPPTQPHPENKAPIIKIEKNIGNGNVEYTITGTDEDGYVKHIDYNINGKDYSTTQNPFTSSHEIIEGNNSINVAAMDNDGLYSVAKDSFYSPTELEASRIIENTLNPSSYNYIVTNAIISVGNSQSFIVNALINTLNGDAIMDYNGASNEYILNMYGIPNRCPNRTSTKNLEDYTIEFEDSDYSFKTKTANPNDYKIIPNYITANPNDYCIVSQTSNKSLEKRSIPNVCH